MSRRNLQFLNVQQQSAPGGSSPNYASMPWPALMKLARERALFGKGDKKQDVIAKLQASDAAL